jgi:hypothetical protein
MTTTTKLIGAEDNGVTALREGLAQLQLADQAAVDWSPIFHLVTKHWADSSLTSAKILLKETRFCHRVEQIRRLREDPLLSVLPRVNKAHLVVGRLLVQQLHNFYRNQLREEYVRGAHIMEMAPLPAGIRPVLPQIRALVAVLNGGEWPVNQEMVSERTPLCTAIEKLESEKAKQLLALGVETNVRVGPRTRQTALMKALDWNQIEVIRILLEPARKTDVSLACSAGRTALYRAAGNGQLEAVQWLLALPVEHDFDRRSSSNDTVATWAWWQFKMYEGEPTAARGERQKTIVGLVVEAQQAQQRRIVEQQEKAAAAKASASTESKRSLTAT